MRESWLVQRLQRPWKNDHPFAADNPFAFGGGMKNGGLSDDAMDLLRSVFRFDYMGAAEFEWGAVPKALNAIAKSHKRLTAWSFPIPLDEVQPHWKDKSQPAPGATGTVYVLCDKDWCDEVEHRIRGWAAKDYGSLKESTRLASALRPVDEFDSDRCGWLELDNGFLFFTDREMWESTCRLFGVDVPAESAA